MMHTNPLYASIQPCRVQFSAKPANEHQNYLVSLQDKTSVEAFKIKFDAWKQANPELTIEVTQQMSFIKTLVVSSNKQDLETFKAQFKDDFTSVEEDRMVYPQD